MRRVQERGLPECAGEAIACATPAVATDVGDVREILGDPRLVAAAGDPASLAACINYVLALGEEGRRALALRQRAEVEARYDIERVWDRYRDLYRPI